MTEEIQDTTPEAPETDNAETEVLESVENETQDAENEQENEENQENLDELEEVDYNDKKYKVPKELKDALLRQSDYTRKTQEVAEQRRALEAEQQALKAAREVDEAAITAKAKRIALETQLREYQTVDWNAYSEQDPVSAQKLFFQYTQLKDQYQSAETQERELENLRRSNLQQETAKRIEKANEILTRDIPGWGAEYAAKLSHFAITKLGYTEQEVNEINDYKVIKLINKAYADSKKVAPPVKTAAVLKGTGSKIAPKDPSKMTDDEYLDYRKAQQAAQVKRR